MGWFTHQSKNWELKVGWLSYLAILFPFVLPPLAMLYMGVVGKIKNLIIASILWSGLYVGGYFLYLFYKDSGRVDVLLFAILLSGALVIAMYLKEFLRRVHLKSIIKIRWNTEYDYLDFMRRKKISEVLSVSDFIEHLVVWQQEIRQQEVRGSIASMIQLTKSITKDNKHISELFIERHAYSIENMLQQYHQIELSKLDNDIIRLAESKIRTTLLSVISAFENELSNKTRFNHLTIDVDSEVYIQDLKNRGLL
ncbi:MULTISPECIES: hypothetical protein [Myroides]|uniref:hypothetical protein n=1 Tax=Myroides TaxID=76831 RepID=UPI000913323C|nr:MULTISPECIES: hypothetical protein [Myroides]MDM1059094.1 hypothetical protein [Myroides odoratimimus]MDM1097428.1 hypothetical protein [Myroides odoratimimus]MDM1507460.1 hypothetical protein [Myroides odoratimimus]MDM1513016.1 hypothetical protein [Myroides odoratimimus]MDM1517872.1 hypothetical protein [Myroides odoratimimus]